MYTYDDVFANKQSILIVVAHPDDVEVFFGATIAKLRQEGKEINILLTTNGARGSREHVIEEQKLAKQRLAEQETALAVLGVEKGHLFCLNHLDGEVESNYQLIGEIAKYIRRFKADIVCTHEPSIIYAIGYDKQGYFVHHRDHRKTGEAVVDAVYPFSRDRSFFPEHLVEGIEPHTCIEILLTDEEGSNFDLVINDLVETKRNALRAHKSQFDEETVEHIINAWKFGDTYMEKFKYVKLQW